MIEPDRKAVENGATGDALTKIFGFLPGTPVNLLSARLSVNLVPGVEQFLPTGGTSHVANPPHGTGGSHLLYRTITTHLAKNEYIVAMLEHPGNNRNNNELEGTYQNLVNRPRHVRLTIDAVSTDAQFSAYVQANNVAIIGHSMGGYTALAVAGGTPWSETGRSVGVVPDARVRALVLLAPATAWYQPQDSLSNVTVPILMLIGEHDPYTSPWHADLVLDRVPDRDQVTFSVIENAGHFSFLSPFPPQMRNANFLPSTDPEGFDRDKFHAQLPGELLDYLDERLRRS